MREYREPPPAGAAAQQTLLTKPLNYYYITLYVDSNSVALVKKRGATLRNYSLTGWPNGSTCTLSVDVSPFNWTKSARGIAM